MSWISPWNFVSVQNHLNHLKTFHQILVKSLSLLADVQNLWLSRSRSQFKIMGLTVEYRVCSNPLKDFYDTFVKCPSQWDYVQNPWLSLAYWRSSQLKVMDVILEFRVCSISHQLFERFSLDFGQMFILNSTINFQLFWFNLKLNSHWLVRTLWCHINWFWVKTLWNSV